jgi:hypothetical protein
MTRATLRTTGQTFGVAMVLERAIFNRRVDFRASRSRWRHAPQRPRPLQAPNSAIAKHLEINKCLPYTSDSSQKQARERMNPDIY